MSTWKKVLNVFKAFFAVLLSILLTLFLIVAPITFSALSLLKANNLTKAVSNIDYNEILEIDDIPLQSDNISSETVEKIMDSPIVEDVLGLYITDATNALAGKEVASKFNADELRKIIDNNLDDVIEIVREVEPELAEISDKEIKEQIKTTFDEHVEELVEKLPPPQEITKELKESNPTAKTVLDILAKTDIIKAVVIAVIVIFIALIFVCRLPGIRGFKWLSFNMFVAFGVLAIVCAVLILGDALIMGMIGSSEILISIFESLTSSFRNGMLIRTGVMLFFAVAFLVAYIIIKKHIAKKELALATEIVPIEDIEEKLESED